MAHDLPRPRVLRLLGLGALLIVGALTPAARAGGSQDLTQLFAPPTFGELNAVRADWANRQPQVQGYRLESTFTSAGGLFHVISHIVDGQRHYGAVRFPSDYVPGQPHGALVVCHGGLNGVSTLEVTQLLGVFPGQCIEGDYFLIIPSFRGEPLVTGSVGTFMSGGTPSWADRDVDDTRSMLSVVLQNYQDIDHARIGAWGASRGGAVALLLAQRDERVRRVVDIYGFTDLSLPSVRTEVDRILNQGATPMGMGRVAFESAVNPWLSGALTLDEARLAWIRRSPCYFAADLPRVQAHHGLSDTQVPHEHTEALMFSLQLAGVSPSEAEAFYYPGGQHGLNQLPGHGQIVEPYICELQIGPRSYCGPMTPHAGGLFAAADYRGSASIGANDLVFRANNCPEAGVGLVFVAATQAYSPSGAGYLCVGLGARRLGIGVIDQQGTFELDVDTTNLDPAVAQFFTVGSSAYFQLVFRDLGNPNGLWNFSNGLKVEFRP